jgi:hypothetical protein
LRGGDARDLTGDVEVIAEIPQQPSIRWIGLQCPGPQAALLFWLIFPRNSAIYLPSERASS